MATFAKDETETLLAELQERTREAWATYSQRVHGLTGTSYEAAEPAAWAELQSTLRTIEADRIDLVHLSS
jgi:hypothetical protein